MYVFIYTGFCSIDIYLDKWRRIHPKLTSFPTAAVWRKRATRALCRGAGLPRTAMAPASRQRESGAGSQGD